MDFSGSTFRATMVVAVLAVTTLKVARGQISCTDDRDCPSDKYCYNVSSMCVDFIPCGRYNRVEGPTPARHSAQCGSCFPGYTAELLSTGVRRSVCKKLMTREETEIESKDDFVWTWHWILIMIIVILLVALLLATGLRRLFCVTNRDRFCEKMISWNARPTAPPQDEAAYHLRRKTYPGDEERPPIYSSVIGPNIDRANLVHAAPHEVPNWVTKPNYDPDYNDNVADGIATPIHNASANLRMDLEEEEETNPSSWTPGQLLTVDVPTRPFARFAIEREDNVLNNVVLNGNCSSNSNHEEGSSDETTGIPEEPSGSRSQGDIFCGPNVQINQTITLNIGKNGTK